MRILVTGGAGFIGSHIAREFLARGHQVSVLDDLSSGWAENLPKAVHLIQRSIMESTTLDADAVIHTAAQVSVAASCADPEADARANILGTVRVLQAAAAAGVRRFLYLSSAAVYGSGATPPTPEDAPLAPASPYGLSKLAGEGYVRLLAEAAGMDWVILRLANVYGPRQSTAGEAGVIARWAEAVAAGTPVILHGDGGQTRDFIYVGDVARAVAAALETGRGIFNVGCGSEVPLNGLLRILQPASVIRKPDRPGDIRRSALDTTRIKNALGWTPATSLEDGLAATLAWFQEMRNGQPRAE